MGSWVENVVLKALFHFDPIYISVNFSRVFKSTPEFETVQMEQESHRHFLSVRGTSSGSQTEDGDHPESLRLQQQEYRPRAYQHRREWGGFQDCPHWLRQSYKIYGIPEFSADNLRYHRLNAHEVERKKIRRSLLK